LCLTPSAVSHQMRELETMLCTRLFERRTRSLALTPAGHRLLEAVEPLLDGLDRALTQLARQDGRETLRVRAPALFANELLIPRLDEFCEAHPLIDVQLDTRDPRPVTHSPTADVSFVLADTPPAGVRSTRLFSSPLTAVCAPQHAGRVARLGRQVFGALPLIVERPEPRQVIEFDTMIAAVRAAERGLGIALVPVVLCQSWIRTGALVRVFAVELSTPEAYYLVSRPRDAERPPVKALTRWALAQYSA